MRTRKRIRRGHRGGMAIQGEQGCVTIPSLVIDAKRTRNVNYVTKLFFTEKFYEDEKANNDFIIKNIDPRESFTAVKYDINPINIKSISEAELAKCPSLKGKDISTLKFLNYKYIGKSISSIVNDNTVFNTTTSKDIIAALANLTLKIYAMNMSGFYHGDAHEGNIMYDERTKHAYLIDFGYAKNATDKPLLDLQLSLNAINVIMSTILAFSKLPESYTSALKAYKIDISDVISRITNGMPTKEAQDLALKTARDISVNFNTITGGTKRKTLRRKRN